MWHRDTEAVGRRVGEWGRDGGEGWGKESLSRPKLNPLKTQHPLQLSLVCNLTEGKQPMDANNQLKDKTVAVWLRDHLVRRFERDVDDPEVCVEDLVDLVEAILAVDRHDDALARSREMGREFIDALRGAAE